MLTGPGAENWMYAIVGGMIGIVVLLLGLLGGGGENGESIGGAWDDFWGEVEDEF
ncbi:MAG: hypothetical protein ACLFTT_03035 [Candidatus Hydrogenedentota bacterium]